MRRSPRRRGLTLLEVVLAVGLLAGLSSMTYWFYGQVLTARDSGMKDVNRLRLARSVMDRIAKEIRQCSAASVDGEVGLRGTGEALWLSSLKMPSTELLRHYDQRLAPPPTEYDIVKVSYLVARHPDVLAPDGYEFPLGLARTERLIPRPLAVPKAPVEGEEGATGESEAAEQARLQQQLAEELGAVQEQSITSDVQWEQLYAQELRYLRFCYFDGHQWWDDWDVVGENPLPQLVMVTVGFEGEAPLEDATYRTKENEEFCECLNRDPPDCEPLRRGQYSTVVRLTQADPLFRSRVTRETQDVVKKLSGESGDEGQQP